jgi:hypothetical protein
VLIAPQQNRGIRNQESLLVHRSLEKFPDIEGQNARQQSLYQHAIFSFHHAGDAVSQSNAGIAQRASPVPRVVAAFTQIEAKTESVLASASGKNGWRRGSYPGAIGRNEHVGGKRFTVIGAHPRRADRKALLTGGSLLYQRLSLATMTWGWKNQVDFTAERRSQSIKMPFALRACS